MPTVNTIDDPETRCQLCGELADYILFDDDGETCYCATCAEDELTVAWLVAAEPLLIDNPNH